VGAGIRDRRAHAAHDLHNHGRGVSQVETWQTNHGDLVLLATVRPRGYNAAALRARISEEPYKTALANVWRVVDVTG